MFAYCLNNPVRYLDVQGRLAAEAAVATTNFWNPIGWIAASLVVVEAVILITAVVSVTYDTNQSSTSQTAHYSKSETSDKHKSTPQVQEKSVSTPSSPTPPNNRNNKDRKISLKRINDNYLKKHGLDAHKIKREYLGSRAPISRYDLAYDTKSRIIYIITKTGKIVYKTYYILR